jgi:hypothetical protein
MELAPLLVLPSPTALEGTDDPIRATRKRPATLNALTLYQWVLLAIFGPTFRVHAFTVPVAPVPCRLTMAFPATRTDSEVHPPVPRELLERQPVTALGTELLALHPLPLPVKPRRHPEPSFCGSLSRGSLIRESLQRGLGVSLSSRRPLPPPGLSKAAYDAAWTRGIWRTK